MGYDVLAIDNDKETVQEIAQDVTHVIQADATDEATLKAVGIRNFDVVVVAIGNDMQASILVTVLLKELNVKYVVAKAQNELHGKILQKVGADKVVFPERDMGTRLALNMVSSNIIDNIQLSPEYSIVEVSSKKQWYGRTLHQLNLKARLGIYVLAIKRGDELLVAPSAQDTIEADDIVIVVGKNRDIDQLERV